MQNEQIWIQGNFTIFKELTAQESGQVQNADQFADLLAIEAQAWQHAISACQADPVTDHSACTNNSTLQQSFLKQLSPAFRSTTGLLLNNPTSSDCHGNAYPECSMLALEGYMFNQSHSQAIRQFQVSLEITSSLLVVSVVLIMILAVAIVLLERKKFQMEKLELKQQVKEARIDAKEKSSFMATVSHELRFVHHLSLSIKTSLTHHPQCYQL